MRVYVLLCFIFNEENSGEPFLTFSHAVPGSVREPMSLKHGSSRVWPDVKEDLTKSIGPPLRC